MFRSSLILMISLLISGYTSAQDNLRENIIPDPRLYEIFDQNDIEIFLNTDPLKILYYNYYLDNAYFLSDVVEGKPVEDLDIFSVRQKKTDAAGNHPLFNEDLSHFSREKFNILKYDFNIQNDRYSHYVLGNTGKVMVFYPGRVFERAFHDYLVSSGFITE